MTEEERRMILGIPSEELERWWKVYDKGTDEYFTAHHEAGLTTFSTEDVRRAAAWGIYRAVMTERERCAGIADEIEDSLAQVIAARIRGEAE